MNKLKQFILFFILVVFSFTANSQPQKDTIRLATAQANTYLKQMQSNYSAGNYNLHKAYSDSLLLVAKTNGLTKMHVLGLTNQAVFYKNHGEKLKAIELYHEALDKCDLIPDDFRTKIVVLINMGNLYNDIGSYDKAIAYIEKVIILLDTYENSDSIRAAALIGLANNYIRFKDYEQTIFYANQAKALGEKINNESILVSAINNISDAYIGLEDYEKALEISQSFEDLSLLSKPTKKRASFLLNRGIAHFRLDKLDEALADMKACQVLSKEKELFETEMYAHEYLAKIYEQKNDFKAAIEAQKTYTYLRNQFLEDKKDASNADLNKEIAVKSETIDSNNKNLKRVTKTQNFIVFIGGGAVLVLSSFLFFYVKRKRKLDKEKEKLQLQHHSLQQSLTALQLQSKKTDYTLETSRSALKPYKNSSLTIEKREQYKKCILEFMTNEKPFLNPEMTQSDLAQQLAISSHHFSEVLYYNMEQNFYNFINSYRILEAQKLMKDPDYKDTKILAIAFDSGFKSKSTFNRIFKNHTGVTPSEYRNQSKNAH
ncbi:MAG: helix-turn-helix domain-containing protein [Winogradskyella sp.]|uniref:helix-turn-helix domain-containing protein n=1 Tax=Winogradskyella sp. TaxID=1883156 RepID=UPI00385C4ED1